MFFDTIDFFIFFITIHKSAMPRRLPKPPAPLPSPRKGGRRRSFEEATVKLALFLPPDLAATLKAFAALTGQTPSQAVARWLEGPEVRSIIPKIRA